MELTLKVKWTAMEKNLKKVDEENKLQDFNL